MYISVWRKFGENRGGTQIAEASDLEAGLENEGKMEGFGKVLRNFKSEYA